MDFVDNLEFNTSENDFWDDLPDELKASINEAKAELDRGEGIPHDDVMLDVRHRFLNLD